jgi:hypothetical protein
MEISISNILVFLKETSIYIRKWHIKRNKEVVKAVVIEEIERKKERKKVTRNYKRKQKRR